MMPTKRFLFRVSLVCAHPPVKEGPFCFTFDAAIAEDLIAGMLAVARTKMSEVEVMGFRDFREGL
jgi:hypothetical protein